LRTLENKIRKAAEEIQKNGLEIGRDLCEIRDNDLWKEESTSWNQYLKERAEELVGKSFAQAASLIRAAEIAKTLPTHIIDDMGLTATHLRDIGRLAPNVRNKKGQEQKDYTKIKKQDVARVLKNATVLAGGKSPSVRDVRKAVDKEIGKDRKAEAAARTKEEAELDRGFMLSDYLLSRRGIIEAITDNLTKVPGESWMLLEESHPGLVTSVAEACENLAALLRS
jgi:hypothetical protein